MTDRVRTVDLDALTRATAHLDPPLAALDRAALLHNAADLVRRAGGKPVRIASKSVRCRSVLDVVLALPGFAGVMAYSLREAIWLARGGVPDVLIGYPSVDAGAIAELVADAALLDAITLMVDDTAQLDVVRAVSADAAVRVCLDIDASLRIGRLHLGVRRSPVRTPGTTRPRWPAPRRTRGFRVVGRDVLRGADRRPARHLAARPRGEGAVGRRAAQPAVAVVEAVEKAVGALEFVNGGGTGSLEVTGADPCGHRVDGRVGAVRPHAVRRLPRLRAAPGAVLRAARSCAGPRRGSRPCSVGAMSRPGRPGQPRLPSPALRGLQLLRGEGAGEVQTPVRGPGAAALRVGDRVWFRHAKAGELAERLDTLHVVEDGVLVESVPTYRGEGRTFG